MGLTDPFVELPILKGSDWAVSLTGVVVKDQVVNISAVKAVFDVTVKYFSVPRVDFLHLLPHLTSNFSLCEVRHLYTFCPEQISDTASFPNITLSLAGYDFSLLPTSYTYTVSGGRVFAFSMREGSEQEWVVGVQFLTDFFGYFNAETRSINVTGGVKSPNRSKKFSEDDVDWPVWAVALIWSIGITVIGTFCCSMLVWTWKKKTDEAQYLKEIDEGVPS